MTKPKELNDAQDSSLHCTCACVTKCYMWVLGIFEILVGSISLNICPLQRFIPIYLLVNGISLILLGLIAIVAGLKPSRIIYSLFCILGIFWFAWLIAGSVWTFPHYHNYEGCNRDVYLFTFSNLIIQWILLIFTPCDIV